MLTFRELGLREEIIRAVEEKGFINPTPIQQEAIPILTNTDTDLVGLAQTGTGKTAGFGLPLIEQIDFDEKVVQGLVICPTRELCNQISDDLRSFSRYIKKSNVVPVFGGASIDKQLKDIRRGPQIIVATPGRLIDFLKRKAINLSAVKICVLDEADEMLNMGFKEDIDMILSSIPEERNVWLFSATMPRDVARIAKNYMTDPREITVGTKNSSAQNIEHRYYLTFEKDRYNALKCVIDYYPDIFGLIFCQTRRDTKLIAERLERDGYSVEPLHGDLSQIQRDRVMKRFREKSIQLLVATDVAARGIDVNDISHVINYTLPDDIECYTHRSGRTARAGKSGVSICFLNSREGGKLKAIENQIGQEFVYAKIPSGKEICENQLLSLIKKVKNIEIKEDQIGDYIPSISQEFEEMSKEELIKRLVSVEFNRFLSFYKNHQDLNAPIKRLSTKMPFGDRGSYGKRDREKYTRFFVNLGEKDSMDVPRLLRLVCRVSGIPGKKIGRISLKDEFSFFEVTDELSDQVVSGFSESIDFRDKEVRVEIAKSQSSGGFRGRSGGGSSRSNGSRRYSGGNNGRSSKRIRHKG